MRIGELARVSAVSPDTIRYYERIGLMPAPRRTPGGYREYPAGAANRIRIIRNAVQLGFPLREIASVLRIRDSGGAPCRQVRDYARTLVGGIEQRIAELQAERKKMRKMIQAWDAALLRTDPGEPVHLLESDSIAIRGPEPKHARLRRAR
jgi:MerR family transcriptional regulator, copper efflux regulator